MKQSQMVNAYKVLENLSKQTMPIKTAYAVHKLRGKLKPAFDFQVEQEERLIEKLNPKIENGSLFFQNVDDAQEWKDEMIAVGNMESDIEFEPIKISINDDLQISLDNIDALEGFVDFVEC